MTFKLNLKIAISKLLIIEISKAVKTPDFKWYKSVSNENKYIKINFKKKVTHRVLDNQSQSCEN